MTIGVVSEIARTDKGAPYIVVNGVRLYASKCETPPTGLTTGMKIDYVAEPFGDTGRDGKRPMGLKRWKAVVNGAGEPQMGSTVTDADVLRSVSNVVGNACAAGSVKSPEELEKWFVAAHRGFLRVMKLEEVIDKLAGVLGEADPDDSAELPEGFFKGLPPGATGKARGPNDPPW
jgi:hypothetical protein